MRIWCLPEEPLQQYAMGKFRVIAGHQRIYELPIYGAAGDRVMPGRRDDDAPGWVWCEHAANGLSGWVPISFLDIRGGETRLRRNYNALELNVSRNEVLEVAEIIEGWAFCSRENGTAGWVPIENLSQDF
jgi:hypothetical protein